MNKVAIAFLTKDKTELSERTVKALLQFDKFDLHWVDGSVTEEGRALPKTVLEKQTYTEPSASIKFDVSGGPDAAVAYALSTMLLYDCYDYIGLCESDVLMDPSWFAPTMALFDRGQADGLEVGAVSARCYQDRILIQRDGYALCHNLGFGLQILTRKAASLVLANFRTGWTADNRRLFCKLSGLDLAAWWAFKANDHPLCADWDLNRLLASHGLASLALVPSPVEMIGQVPALAEQGLAIAKEPFDLLRNNKAFERFCNTTRAIRAGEWSANVNGAVFVDDNGASIYYPHQLGLLEGVDQIGDWRLRWVQGCGPFAWRSNAKDCSLTVCLSGPCEFNVSGGAKGGTVILEDLTSGYTVKPQLPAGDHAVALVAPCGVSHRPVRLTFTQPGMTFYGLRTKERQAERLDWSFDWSMLPRV